MASFVNGIAVVAEGVEGDDSGIPRDSPERSGSSLELREIRGINPRSGLGSKVSSAKIVRASDSRFFLFLIIPRLNSENHNVYVA